MFTYGPRLKSLYKLISRRGRIPLSDMIDRPLICCGIPAHYGTVSHWVLSVEGTPPRGTIVFDVNRYSLPQVLLTVQQAVYRIRGRQYETVEAFVDEHLTYFETTVATPCIGTTDE